MEITVLIVRFTRHRCLQCALLANSAGIGGGPFYIPLLNVVVGFSLEQCVGLSHTIVSTSAIASALYGLTHTRPGYPDRPLVDLDVALIFIPALLFGTGIGILPSVVLCCSGPPGLIHAMQSGTSRHSARLTSNLLILFIVPLASSCCVKNAESTCIIAHRHATCRSCQSSCIGHANLRRLLKHRNSLLS